MLRRHHPALARLCAGRAARRPGCPSEPAEKRSGRHDLSNDALAPGVHQPGGGTPEAAISAVRTIVNDPKPAYLALWPALPATFAIATASPLGLGQLSVLDDNLGDTMVDNNGNTLEVGIFTPLTPLQIATIAPAGVALMTGDDLIDNLNDFIVDNAGNQIAVLSFAAVP